MSSFIQVLKKEKPSETPVWLMRQAGRYLPEYRELRGSVPGFLDAVFNPDMASEITLQPLRRFPELDAAILFSDILVIPYALGQKVEFVKGEGPQLSPFNALNYDAAKLDPVYAALRKVRAQLPQGKTLIGFAGSPWTVACYMVSGNSHDEFKATKEMAQQKPEKLAAIIDTVTNATIDYLGKQIDCGADVIQLFESHSGVLADNPVLFQKWVLEPTKKIVAALKKKYPTTPIIGFPRNAGDLMPVYAAETRIDAVGLDWSVDLAWANEVLPKNFPVQGNLNPALLVQGGEALKIAAKNILKTLENRPHIFNLGHGVVPETPPEHVAALLKTVKEKS